MFVKKENKNTSKLVCLLSVSSFVYFNFLFVYILQSESNVITENKQTCNKSKQTLCLQFECFSFHLINKNGLKKPTDCPKQYNLFVLVIKRQNKGLGWGEGGSKKKCRKTLTLLAPDVAFLFCRSLGCSLLHPRRSK